MSQDKQLLADTVSSLQETEGKPLTVILSHELVHLLSVQLYHSPLKAIEELVVNAYDAEAKECRVFVPAASNQEHRFIVIFDNGTGMDYQGLTNLWHIGHSNKREDEIERRAKRKQIGKFGIGKLATYTIANKLTYITRTKNLILTVTIDFSKFIESPTGPKESVNLPVKKIADWKRFAQEDTFEEVCKAAKIDSKKLFNKSGDSWTIAILEELKDKAAKIKLTTLRWVLSTAMPLNDEFKLYLNGDEVTSSKESYKKKVKFDIAKLPKHRIESLKKATGENWRIAKGRLFSESFPNGISGVALVTEESLYAGKSADLGRSHGFFVKVLGRLVNQEDPLFGLKPRSYETFNRFRADIEADDLDVAITAPREGVEESALVTKFRDVLYEVFNEARQRYEDSLTEGNEPNKRKKEEDRNYVNPRLVERPIADVLAVHGTNGQGPEADETWFYLNFDSGTDIKKLVRNLYDESKLRSKYTYKYTNQGASERLSISSKVL